MASVEANFQEHRASRDRRISLSNQYAQDKLRSDERRSDQLLNSLSGFSKTLQEKLVSDEAERIKKAIEEGKANVHEKQLEDIENTGEDTIPEEEKEDSKVIEGQIIKGKKAFDNAALNIQKKGGRYEDAYNVKSLSGWRLWSERNETAAVAGRNYAGWIEGEMKNNDVLEIEDENGETFTPATADSLEKKRRAMKALRSQYMDENGLTGMDRTILSKHFYQPAVAANKALATKYEREDRISGSIQERDDAKRYYHSSKDDEGSFGRLLDSYASTVDNDDTLLGRAGALDEAFKTIIELSDIGEFDKDTDYRALGEQEVTVNGVTKKVKDMWPFRYAKLREDLFEEEKKNFNASQEEKEMTFKEGEQSVIDQIQQQLKEDPSKVDHKYLQELKSELETANPGFKSTKLDNYIKFAAPDAVALAAQEAELKDLISKNLLTTDRLLQSDVRLHDKYKKEAAAITKAISKENAVDIEFLETAVENFGRQSSYDLKNPTVGPMQSYLVAEYHKHLRDAVLADDPNPSQYARERASAWWQSFIDNPNNYDKDGFKVPGFKLSSAELSQRKENIAKEVNRIQNVIKNTPIPKLMTPESIGTLISKDSTLQATLAYQKNPKGWDYPKEVNALYEVYGNNKTTKYKIWQDIQKAHGIKKGIETTPSIEKADKTLSKADTVTLSAGTNNASTRVLAESGMKSGTKNVEFVPDGQGEPLQIWSDENEMDFGESGAAYEFLKANPSIAKKFLDSEVGEGELDWDRLGLAISTLSHRFGTHMQTRTQALGDEVMQTAENMSDAFNEAFTVDPETDPGNIIGTQIKDTFDQTFTVDKETDPGYIIGTQVAKTFSDIVGWTNEQINAFADSILGEVTEDQVLEFRKAKWKYDPSPENLMSVTRNRY